MPMNMKFFLMLIVINTLLISCKNNDDINVEKLEFSNYLDENVLIPYNELYDIETLHHNELSYSFGFINNSEDFNSKFFSKDNVYDEKYFTNKVILYFLIYNNHSSGNYSIISFKKTKQYNEFNVSCISPEERAEAMQNVEFFWKLT